MPGNGLPATTAKTGVTGSPAAVTVKAAKKPASSASITVLPDQPVKPVDSDSAPPKKPNGSAVPKTGSEPEASQTNPQSARPKPVASPTPPPANVQPPADENKPQ